MSATKSTSGLHVRNFADVTNVQTPQQPVQWCEADSTCRPFFLNSCSLNFRIPLLYGCPKSVPRRIYDEDFATSVVLPFVGASYVDNDSEVDAAAHSAVRLAGGPATPKVLKVLKVLESDWFGFLAYLPREKAIVVVFQGSSSIFQLIDEGISLFLRAKIRNLSTGGLVDEYYLKAFHTFWGSGLKDNFEATLKKHPKIHIWFFGHSLGGGLASLAAAPHFCTYRKDDSIRLMTFGQPKVGDINFAQRFNKLVPNAVRVVHDRDPVPMLPPRLLHFGLGGEESFHHYYEVRYELSMKRGSPRKIRRYPDSSRNDWMFLVSLNINEHLVYFEKNLSS